MRGSERMKKKQKTWLILQILWVLIFVIGAVLLQGKYRRIAIICAFACAFSLVLGLQRARTAQKLSVDAFLNNEKNGPDQGEKL